MGRTSLSKVTLDEPVVVAAKAVPKVPASSSPAVRKRSIESPRPRIWKAVDGAVGLLYAIGWGAACRRASQKGKPRDRVLETVAQLSCTCRCSSDENHA